MKLILASTSPFRKVLLEKLQLDFICEAPDIDETPLKDETIKNMVIRLAEAKAQAIATHHPNALIIGSDQSAVLNGTRLTKPGNFDTAFRQLKAASGQKIIFQTGLCLLNTSTNKNQSTCIPYSVEFRQLCDTKIKNYLEKEQPFNCVGSFKSEALGITLFKRFDGEDPNALIGLPLIQLITFLENEGISIPDNLQ